MLKRLLCLHLDWTDDDEAYLNNIWEKSYKCVNCGKTKMFNRRFPPINWGDQ